MAYLFILVPLRKSTYAWAMGGQTCIFNPPARRPLQHLSPAPRVACSPSSLLVELSATCLWSRGAVASGRWTAAQIRPCDALGCRRVAVDVSTEVSMRYGGTPARTALSLRRFPFLNMSEGFLQSYGTYVPDTDAGFLGPLDSVTRKRK